MHMVTGVGWWVQMGSTRARMYRLHGSGHGAVSRQSVAGPKIGRPKVLPGLVNIQKAIENGHL